MGSSFPKYFPARAFEITRLFPFFKNGFGGAHSQGEKKLEEIEHVCPWAGNGQKGKCEKKYKKGDERQETR